MSAVSRPFRCRLSQFTFPLMGTPVRRLRRGDAVVGGVNLSHTCFLHR